MKRIFLFLLFVFINTAYIYSQIQPACLIVFADGEGFTVVSNSRETYYDLFEDDVFGLELRENDLIITEPGTLVEIQIASSNNIIKISENSSFRINTYEEKGGGFFSIAYGRIRARVDIITGGESFRVEGISAVCGVRGTDFGYDIIADPAGADRDLLTRIYCFSGSVEVETIAKDGFEETITETLEAMESIDTASLLKAQRFILTGNEMVSIAAREPLKPVVIEEVSRDVILFWDSYSFVTKPQTIITMDDIGQAYSEKQFENKKSLFWGSMGLVFAGASLEIASFIMRDVVPGRGSTGVTFNLSVTGAILMGSGFTGLGAAAFMYK